jgi:hypothetical protein
VLLPVGSCHLYFPRAEALGFYEADDFVKTRWKIFLLFLIHFGRHLTTPHLFGFGA